MVRVQSKIKQPTLASKNIPCDMALDCNKLLQLAHDQIFVTIYQKAFQFLS